MLCLDFFHVRNVDVEFDGSVLISHFKVGILVLSIEGTLSGKDLWITKERTGILALMLRVLPDGLASALDAT